MFLLWESFRSAIHAIRANTMRSILTSLGIIIGVASIITVVSLVQGLQTSIEQQFESLGSNTLIIQPDFNVEEYEGKEIYLDENDLLAIRKRADGIESVAPQAIIGGKALSYRGKTSNSQVTGVEPALFSIDDTFAEKGRVLIASDLTRRARIIVIGEQVRQDLNLPANPIGQFIQFGKDWLKIVGLLESKGSFLGQNQDNVAYLPFSTALSVTPTYQRPFMYFFG